MLIIERDDVIQITASLAPELFFSERIVVLPSGLPIHGALP
jgi:hypothetical protein